jgi:hypothetical protein
MLILGVEAGGVPKNPFRPAFWGNIMMQLEIRAHSAADMYAKLAGIGGKAVLASVSTEALIEELRERMAKRGHVVNIDPVQPFADEEDSKRGPRRGSKGTVPARRSLRK